MERTDESSADGWCTASCDPDRHILVTVWDSAYGWDRPADPTDWREYWLPDRMPAIQALQEALRLDDEIEKIIVIKHKP